MAADIEAMASLARSRGKRIKGGSVFSGVSSAIDAVKTTAKHAKVLGDACHAYFPLLKGAKKSQADIEQAAKLMAKALVTTKESPLNVFAEKQKDVQKAYSHVLTNLNINRNRKSSSSSVSVAGGGILGDTWSWISSGVSQFGSLVKSVFNLIKSFFNGLPFYMQIVVAYVMACSLAVVIGKSSVQTGKDDTWFTVCTPVNWLLRFAAQFMFGPDSYLTIQQVAEKNAVAQTGMLHWGGAGVALGGVATIGGCLFAGVATLGLAIVGCAAVGVGVGGSGLGYFGYGRGSAEAIKTINDRNNTIAEYLKLAWSALQESGYINTKSLGVVISVLAGLVSVTHGASTARINAKVAAYEAIEDTAVALLPKELQNVGRVYVDHGRAVMQGKSGASADQIYEAVTQGKEYYGAQVARAKKQQAANKDKEDSAKRETSRTSKQEKYHQTTGSSPTKSSPTGSSPAKRSPAISSPAKQSQTNSPKRSPTKSPARSSPTKSSPTKSSRTKSPTRSPAKSSPTMNKKSPAKGSPTKKSPQKAPSVKPAKQPTRRRQANKQGRSSTTGPQ